MGDYKINFHSETVPPIVPSAPLPPSVIGVPRQEKRIILQDVRWMRDFVRQIARGGNDHKAFLITLVTCAFAILILTAIVAKFETVKYAANYVVIVIMALYIFRRSVVDKNEIDVAAIREDAYLIDDEKRIWSIIGLFGSMGAAIYAVTGTSSDNKLLLVSSTFAGFAAVYFLFKLRHIPYEIDKDILARFPTIQENNNNEYAVPLEDFRAAYRFALLSSGRDWYHLAVIIFFCLGSLTILIVTTCYGDFEDIMHRGVYFLMVIVSLYAFYFALDNKHTAEILRFTLGKPFDFVKKFFIGSGITIFIGCIAVAVFVMAINDKLLAASAAYQCLQSVYYAFKLVQIPKNIRVEMSLRYPQLAA